MQRVQAIISDRDDDKRNELYGSFYHQLCATAGAAPLSREETNLVLDFLEGQPRSSRERGWLWKLLLFSTYHDRVRDHALVCSAKEDSYIRGLAFQCLQKQAPELIPELVTRFADDPSPHIRYHVAITERRATQRRVLLEAILVDTEDHELADAIRLELESLGTATK